MQTLPDEEYERLRKIVQQQRWILLEAEEGVRYLEREEPNVPAAIRRFQAIVRYAKSV
jgi:hypothetical protein